MSMPRMPRVDLSKSRIDLSKVDLTELKKLPDALTLVFYAFMFFALVAVAAGSPGWAFLLLIVGAGGHVVRAGLEDFAAQRAGGEDEPAIEIRRVSRPKAAQRQAAAKRQPSAKRQPATKRQPAEKQPRAAGKPVRLKATRSAARSAARPRTEGSAAVRRSTPR